MKQILSEEFRRMQKLAGIITEGENTDQALDQLKEVWFDLEEPIETLRRRLNNREASIESIYAGEDDLGMKVIGMVEKMKTIC